VPPPPTTADCGAPSALRQPTRTPRSKAQCSIARPGYAVQDGLWQSLKGCPGRGGTSDLSLCSPKPQRSQAHQQSRGGDVCRPSGRDGTNGRALCPGALAPGMVSWHADAAAALTP
jgi:hypothetical protein